MTVNNLKHLALALSVAAALAACKKEEAAPAATTAAAGAAGIDLVVLDLGLADGEGETLMAELRKRQAITVIVI